MSVVGPKQLAERCPGCGQEGDGDDVLANDQRWCPDPDCRVVSYTEGSA